MKLNMTEEQYLDALEAALSHGNSEKPWVNAVADELKRRLDLEFLPASQPEAEESWPARLEVRCEPADHCGLVYVRLLASETEWTTCWLTEEEAPRLRELVARYNALERVGAETGDSFDRFSWREILEEEREEVRP